MDIGKRFDTVANRYDTPDKEERSRIFVNSILQHLPDTSDFKVMDIGAGTGTVDMILSDHVREIVAFDLSQGMLDVFRQKIERSGKNNIRIYKKDIFSEDFPEKDFDLVITSMTFHHLKDPVSALNRLKGYLKKGGYIAIIDLYREDGSFHSDNTDVFHFGFDREEVKNWLKETSLEEVYYGIIHTLQKEREGQKKGYPIFLIIAIKN
ncbi:class I SAM-dependent methyltransferase [Persephonella sp.]